MTTHYIILHTRYAQVNSFEYFFPLLLIFFGSFLIGLFTAIVVGGLKFPERR